MFANSVPVTVMELLRIMRTDYNLVTLRSWRNKIHNSWDVENKGSLERVSV